MTMPKGWNPAGRKDQSTGVHETQFSGLPEKKVEYRNPIPPAYILSSSPLSRSTWPSRTTSSRKDNESSEGSVVAIIIIVAVLAIVIVAIFTGPYTLIMIPIVVIGLLRGLGRGSGMNQYRDNMSRHGRRSK